MLETASPRATRATASVKAETVSDNDEQDNSVQLAQRKGRSRHSPSPTLDEAAPKTRKSPARKVPKVEIDVSQDVDAMFENIPSRRRLRRDRSPSPQAATVAKVESPKPRSRPVPVIDADANLDDAFDNMPSRQRGRRARSRSPGPALAVKTEASPRTSSTRNPPVIDADANIDDAFESRRTRRARDRSPTPPPATANIKTTESPVPNRSSPGRGQRSAASEPVENVKVKSEPVTPAKPTAAKLKRVERVSVVNVMTDNIMSDSHLGENIN